MSKPSIIEDMPDKLSRCAYCNTMLVVKDAIVLIHLSKSTLLEKSCKFLGDVLTPKLVYKETVEAGRRTKREDETILTPHPGEMSRIAEIKIDEIKRKSVDTLQQTATKPNAIIVLKEARSLTGYPDGRVLVNVSGNPGMATAGSGDVLTGAIAAMYGLDFSIEDSAPMGVFLHGISGDLAAGKKGEDGMTAQDILDFLPDAPKYYRENFDRISKDLYGSISEI